MSRMYDEYLSNQYPLYLKDFFFKPKSVSAKKAPLHKPSRPYSIRTGIRNIFAEYCSSSSIHGVTYIGSYERTPWERFWWILMVGLSLYGCVALIGNIYFKWEHKPVILSFNEEPISVWEIPFPAITICPESKFRPETINFTLVSDQIFDLDDTELSEDEIQTMLSLLQVCDRMYSHGRYQQILKKYKLKQNVVDRLYDICPGNSKDMIIQCRMSIYPCEGSFRETVTDEGICYTYNLIPEREMFRKNHLHKDYEYYKSLHAHSNWSLDEGYKPNAALRTFPSRVYGSGFEAGLYMQLRMPKAYDEYHCREALGFKVLLHSPAEFPVISRKFIRLTYNHEVTMALKPQITSISNSLRSYNPFRRQCFFNYERKLEFFAVYNQANCELECLTNHTLKLCGCVRFSMPYSQGTKICETSQLECAIQAENEIQLLVATEGIQKNSSTSDHCLCLPACNSIEYDSELTQTKYDHARSFQLRYRSQVPDDLLEKVVNNNFAKLAIYFKQAQYMALKRSELFGWTDFIANCGGVLGLCMGVSLLSLAELLYYCVVRPILLIRDFRKRGRENAIMDVQPTTSVG